MSTQTTFMESKAVLNFEDPSIVHDRVIVVGEKKFHVISGNLSLWSEHFRGLFSGNFRETDKKEIELKELDANIFEIFLRSIYERNLPCLKVSDIISMIEISYSFLAPIVLQQCIEFIDNNMDKMDNIMIKLLDTACVHGIDELKKKLTNYVQNAEVLTKFNCLDLLELATENELDDLKNHISSLMKDNISAENIPNYLDCCEKFGLADLKADICTVIKSWEWDTIPIVHILELAKCAFKHNLEILKVKVRLNIFCMIDEKQKSCVVRARDGGKITTADTINWFIKDNQKEISALPTEISYFIFLSVCQSKM